MPRAPPAAPRLVRGQPTRQAHHQKWEKTANQLEPKATLKQAAAGNFIFKNVLISTSRAADLLAKQGFVGFGGFSPASELEIETLGDGTLRVLLKKLGKRDAVTRIKAVDELCEYISQSEPQDVELLLSNWVRGL
jgi:hypothetical protein